MALAAFGPAQRRAERLRDPPLAAWSIYQRDYPVTQSTILFVAVLFMALNLAVDLLYGYLEPRIRYGD